MKYLVDGYFLTERINGVQRFGYEILKRWDTYEEAKEIQVLVPAYYEGSKAFRNLDIIRYGSNKGRLWEQIDFPGYLKKHKQEGIYFTNLIPVTCKKGIVVLHDVIFKARPDFFNKSFRGKVSVFWRTLLYKLIVKSDMKIVTVSEFSKSEIIRLYGVKADRITVVYNSWQHMNDVTSDDSVLLKAGVEDGSFFFSMATIAKNKNFEWILHCANNNPDQMFVIAGGGDLDKIRCELGFGHLNNVKFLGYVSDEEAKSLMKHCKAFLFPTLYEGFGIPPLEAAACGAGGIVVSDTACMHEIYGNYATYVNPLEYSNIKISDHMQKNMNELLQRYDWDVSAKKLYELLIER